MKDNCIIENWIIKNKTWLGFLTAIICIWFISVIMLITFKYWYFDLSWHDSRISLSNMLSLGATIGAIAVAVFAWMAYRYAIDSYIKQQNAKALWEKKYTLITDIVNGTLSFTMIANGVFYGNNRFFKDFPIISDGIENLFLMYLEDTKKVNEEINNLNNIILKQAYKFPELNLLGVSEKDIENISGLLHKLAEGLREYQQNVTKYLQILEIVRIGIVSNENSIYEQKIADINQIDTDAFNIPKVNEAYNGLMKIGQRLLNTYS